MIKKQIDKPKDLSTDSVLSIIEMNLAGRYKTSRVSDSKLNIRRLYRYISANSREVAHKRMNFKDSGYFLIRDNSIVFRIVLGKQILFWLALLVFGVLLTWKVWNASFLLALFLIITPILVVWINGIIEIKEFMRKELMEISRHLRV
jgi:hypothetical protein